MVNPSPVPEATVTIKKVRVLKDLNQNWTSQALKTVVPVENSKEAAVSNPCSTGTFRNYPISVVEGNSFRDRSVENEGNILQTSVLNNGS